MKKVGIILLPLVLVLLLSQCDPFAPVDKAIGLWRHTYETIELHTDNGQTIKLIIVTEFDVQEDNILLCTVSDLYPDNPELIGRKYESHGKWIEKENGLRFTLHDQAGPMDLIWVNDDTLEAPGSQYFYRVQ